MSYRTLYAIMPEYTDYGENTTRIYLPDGTSECLLVPIRSYIRHMLYDAHLDPRALQHWTYTTLGNKLNTPLILNDSLIFIPVKVRQAIGKSDGCFGYVLLSAIQTFDDNTLTLPTTTLTTRSPKTYITKKIRDANLLRYAYLEHRKQYAFMHE